MPASWSTEVCPQNPVALPHRFTLRTVPTLMTPVGFEPTQLALVELESTPLDHSGKVSMFKAFNRSTIGEVANCSPCCWPLFGQ